jgi:hypothetical protein
LFLGANLPSLGQTATGLHTARGEILVIYLGLVSALALAQPTAIAMGVARYEFDNDQAAEGFVDE